VIAVKEAGRMGVLERREREREEVRRKILDAARTLFTREGYEKVTMRAIAEAIEYSPTTIYNHFRDKDALVDSLCEEDFGRLLGALQKSPAPTDPVEWIRELGRAYCAFGRAYPNHYRFMFMTPGKFPDDHELSMPGQRAFGLLLDAVREAIRQGAFVAGDALTMAQVLWSSIHGVVALLVTYKPEQFPHGPAAADLAEQVCANGIRGFLARAE
jgi:AcrR family transcriptional regulator